MVEPMNPMTKVYIDLDANISCSYTKFVFQRERPGIDIFAPKHNLDIYKKGHSIFPEYRETKMLIIRKMCYIFFKKIMTISRTVAFCPNTTPQGMVADKNFSFTNSHLEVS